MERINYPRDLRPGDIMFGPISGAVGLGVGLGQLALREGFRVGRLSVRHVAIVTQAASVEKDHALRIVQAMPSGAEEVDLTAAHWSARHAYVRLPEDYTGQRGDAAALAQLMAREGVPYSFLSYAALAAWRWGWRTPRLERWIGRTRPCPEPAGVALPEEAICSVLVDQAWSLAGKRVMEGVPRQCVTPGAMAGQLMWREGATWAVPVGPGLIAHSWTI